MESRLVDGAGHTLSPGGTMRLDRRGVDEKLRRRSASLRERMEEVGPHALRRPADIAVVVRLPRLVFRGRINPAPAGFHRWTILLITRQSSTRASPLCVGRKVGRNLRKLGVGQPKSDRGSSALLFGSL